MKYKKNWFTLLEILVASFILSIVVFSVLKLISENKKLINNSKNITNMYNLVPNIKECIKNIWYENFKNNTQTWYSINFWNDLKSCQTWNLNYTSINIEWIDYISNIILTKQTDIIDFEIEVKSDWVWNIKNNYKLIKK